LGVEVGGIEPEVEMEVGDGITDDIFVNKEPWRLFG
jgi:hypothetical protein